jgi:hypothetical protein
MVKDKKLKNALAEATSFRKELGKKTGVTQSSVEIIREDRDHCH